MAIETVDLVLDTTWQLISAANTETFDARVDGGAAFFFVGANAPSALTPGFLRGSLSFPALGASKVWARAIREPTRLAVVRTVDSANPASIALSSTSLQDVAHSAGANEGAVIVAITDLTGGSSVAIVPNDGRYVFVRTGDTTGDVRRGKATLTPNVASPVILVEMHPRVISPMRRGFQVTAQPDAPKPRLVNTVMGGLISNNVLPTSGSKTRFKGRRAYPFGLFTPPSIQPTYCPFWTNGTYGQREVAAAQDITITKAAAVYNGVSVPVTYNGSRTFTIPAGVAEFSCDPIPPTAFGVAQFAPRSFVEYRHLFDLVAGQSAPYCDYSTDFNQSWRGAASDLGDDVDGTGPMTVSNTPDALNIFFPSMMLGTLPAGAVSLGFLFDSIGRQQNDTGGLGRVGGGYMKRAAYAEGIPFMMMAVGGRTAEQTANSPKLLSLLEAGRFTDIHIGLGTNELAGSRDLSLIMADNRAIWASARKGAIRTIIQSNIQPRVTDNAYKCTDLANQSPVAGFEAGGRRDQFNTALAAERGVNGGPDIIFPFSSYCADTSNPSLWRVPTFSGTLTADVAAGATSIQTSAAPGSLDNLVFEPGNSSNVDIGGQGGPRVASVSGTASPYTVSFLPGTTNPWNGATDGALGTPGKAHLSGSAVKASLGTDGTHPATSAHVAASVDLRPVYQSLTSVSQMQVLAMAATKGLFPGQKNSANNVMTDGTVTSETSRVAFYAGRDGIPANSLQLPYINAANNSGDLDTGNDINVSATIEIGGVLYQGGSVTIASGAIGIIPIPAHPAVAAGGRVDARTYVSVASGGKWPIGRLFSNGRNGGVAGTEFGEGSNRSGLTGAVSPAGSDQTQTTGTTNLIASGGQGYCYAPFGLLSLVPRTRQRFAFFADSIGAGEADTQPFPTREDAFLQRLLGSKGLPYLSFAKSGGTMGGVVNNSTRRRAAGDLAKPTHILCELGTNDISGGPTLASFQVNMLAGWKLMKAIGAGNLPVYQTTILPRTNVGNTAPINTGFETARVGFNNWLRDGAPTNASGVAVAAGSSGSDVVRAGNSAHPLAGYIEIADILESGRDTGLWGSSWVPYDGIHPGNAGHTELMTNTSVVRSPANVLNGILAA